VAGGAAQAGYLTLNSEIRGTRLAGSTPATEALDALGVPYRFFYHPGQVTSLEQAARERDQQPSQIIRSIVFRLAEDDYIVVLVAGPSQISWPALRAYLGKSRMTMASREEVLAVTRYPIGAVSPFGLPVPMRILVDRGVIQEGEISLGSGQRNTAIFMRSSDLIKALGEVEVSDFI
jgi:Cys-tRNA(Pro)/Cys-tRNA(Cys) deacylase